MQDAVVVKGPRVPIGWSWVFPACFTAEHERGALYVLRVVKCRQGLTAPRHGAAWKKEQAISKY